MLNAMLTKDDLQAIGGLLDDRFKKELHPIKRELSRLNRKVDGVINFFDRNITDHEKRIRNLENYVNHSK
jgi:hypothetical protein